MRVAVSAICFLAAASACASTGSNPPSFAAAPERQYVSPEQFAAQRDSARAQRFADSVGPGASIRAEFANISGMRRVVASFHVNADAYVLVGHIDADGILRIAFPMDPRDDGFVRGNHDYRTPEFFAGFTEEYRFRAQQPGFNQAARPLDSYDGQLGYAFIIASWRPLAFDRFQTDGRWDSFELADDRYLNDPRPAIYELASMLAGPNREAYTVEFARYTTTSSLYGYAASDYGAFGRGAFDYCLGYSPIGYGYSSILPNSMFIPIASYDAGGYPSSFYSRGRYYFYDDLAGCYRSGYPPGVYSGFYGYRVAGTGPTPPVPVPMRGFSPRDRSPVAPTNVGGHTLPVTRSASDGGNQTPLSSTYRQRGLITADDPATIPSRRTPTIDARSQVENHTRPSIQDMVSRHPQSPDAASGASAREQSLGRTSTDQSSQATQSQRAHPTTSGSPAGVRGEARGYQPPSSEPRNYSPPQGQTRTQPAPQVESRPVVREAPPASRPTPPAEVRVPSPPPSPPPSSPPPASSSSSSSPPPAGGRPPGPPGK